MSSQVTPSMADSTDLNPARMGSCPVCGGGMRPFLAAPDRFHGRTELYQLVECSSCSYVWQQNPPPLERMGEHYGEDYDRSVAAAGEEPNRWRSRWETLAQHKSGGALLDLGCSAGGFLAGLRNSSWTLYGIEMSNVVAKKAQAKSGAQVFVGDILDAPFPPASFDAITCFHVFEHLYQPREILAKVYEWLKQGGIFYVMVPNIDSAGFRIFKSYWYALELPRHLSFFSPKSLRAMAQSVGLEEVSITTYREVFIEASTRYILDDKLRRLGIERIPLARAPRPGIPFRVIRKAIRLTVLPVLNTLAALAGDGESIHAIFRKGASW
jgi:SAM-dependent methyltransferase